ncbi:MAG: 50S ribosomal protein L29 [candidate division WOR-3 bacterium]|nr:50S ribosomal protein L29 [candidate division WOR-3 bacterium]MCX7757515.1 50S ribosomal protein L29 [candidate division WOR-3 bacterium]MDW7987171.1 50S ribosomal protein L29 [candidate division WOR-3 bacterium]
MKAAEIRNMTKEEMLKKLEELQDELLRLKIRHETEELPNPLRLRTIRRDIARIKTVLRELELKEIANKKDQKTSKSKNK